ncbi:hypothetical protein [Corynebacterium sp. UBA2622]|uniref:hypothetical protein n=1 Tax=Corynebacterium sp. UBA2622 TaxID=1946393 RepID=UPI0025BC8084|nr:hypothetical protein [Corynebacterium sp. UBA2622]
MAGASCSVSAWGSHLIWGLTAVAFLAYAVMGHKGMDTNVGGGLALVAALILTLMSDAVTLAMLLTWVAARPTPGKAAFHGAIRKVTWVAAAVTLLGTGLILVHFPPLSYAAVYLYVSLALLAGTAALLSRGSGRARRHR